MIALNIVLMAVVILTIASALAYAIVSDRRSKRASGAAVSPSDAPLHDDLMMPREMRRPRRTGRMHARRNRETGSRESGSPTA